MDEKDTLKRNYIKNQILTSDYNNVVISDNNLISTTNSHTYI
jgi:hypothetical protein